MGAARPINYRADIDGLRAVAVLSVLLFHIDYSWVPGGYTGVDIFFVISGFLITRIIGLDIERGKFSLRWFYVRRIRRILPVFYTVTAITMLVGFILLLPEDLHSFLSSVRYAVVFAANIYFSKDKGYFDISADEKPMLHIWSLSIEEQYYFIWPLLLLLFYTVGSSAFKQRRYLGQPAAVIFTLTLIFLGFAYAQTELVSKSGTTKLYFVLQTRFSELMIGSLTALLPLYRNRVALRVMGYIGGLLIGLGLVTLNKDSLFPGLNALYPCLGAALLIYSGQEGGGKLTLLHRTLGLSAMASIGLLSYSLYLWHWPVLAYMRYVYGSYLLPWHWIVQAVVLTFALAFLSYRYVERNTKTVVLTFRRALLGVFLMPALVILATTYGMERMRPVVKVDAALSGYGDGWCHGEFSETCSRGDPTKSPSVLMIGDSYTAMLNSFIDVVGRNEGWSADVVSSGACSPVFGFDEMLLPRGLQKPCADLQSFVEQEHTGYERILVASRWARHLGMANAKPDPEYLDKLEQTLTEMAQSAPVYVFSSIPRLTVQPFRQAHFARLGLVINRPSSDEHERANAMVRRLIEKIQNVHWIDLSPAWEQFDHSSTYKGKPTYFDDRHLNVYGARTLGEIFVKSGAGIMSQ